MSRGNLGSLVVVALLTLLVSQEAGAQSSRVRAFGSLPDWRGLWIWKHWQTEGASGEPLDAGGIQQIIAAAQLAGHPPYNPVWEARYQASTTPAALAAYAARSKDCTNGFPVQMESPQTFQVVVVPEETVMLFESLERRIVYTDGRGHPAKRDVWPTRWGDSVGHWEGDTLIVDTVARTAGPIGWLAGMSLLSDQAHFIERIRLTKSDELEDQMTIDDPVTFARPWTVLIRYRRLKDIDRLIPYDCEENDRNPVVDGKLTIKTP